MKRFESFLKFFLPECMNLFDTGFMKKNFEYMELFGQVFLEIFTFLNVAYEAFRAGRFPAPSPSLCSNYHS